MRILLKILLLVWASSASASERPLSDEDVYTCAAEFKDEDALPGVYVDLEVADSRWDASCFVDVAQLGSTRRLIVDLRDEAAFNQLHIPGALNMPAHLVKRKPFLRGRSVLLVDDGRGHKQTQAVCLALREVGVEALVLQGGLRRWHDQGHELTGSAAALADLDQLDAKTLIESFNFNAWLLVDVTASGKYAQEIRVADDLLRREAVFHRPYDGNGRRFVARLQQWVKTLKPRPGTAAPLTLVLADETGRAYGEIKKALLNTSLAVDVLFVTGGMTALADYRQSHALMWARLDNPPMRRGCNG